MAPGASASIEGKAAIAAESPPFMLTQAQFFAWTPGGPLADQRNISRVPLAPRFIDTSAEPDGAAKHDPNVRVLIAPDGMNGFGNYLTQQPKFNLYTFTHWSHVDLLVWFGGSTRWPVSVPARPWIEAAHRNGVKVLGTVFFAPTEWGGSPEAVETFLRRDSSGRFPAADLLVAIARHYGFDGWLINQETDLTRPGPGGEAAAHATAERMKEFVAALTQLAQPPMEILWYDAMLPDGRVLWQNELNRQNVAMFQDGRERVSDAVFLNYDWTPQGLRKSALFAESIGRSRYELFIGADLWPRRNAQPAFRNSRWLRDLREGEGGRAFGSIALFAPNFNFNLDGWDGTSGSSFQKDPAKLRSFYDGELRLFAGDDRNMAIGGKPRGPSSEWGGLAAIVPARSTITRLPFVTGFNTGHGRLDARRGRIVGGAWHDMSRQDLLPNWQFAYTAGAKLRVGYDFDRPYNGGSSLFVESSGVSGRPAQVPLFLTRLRLGRDSGLAITSRTSSPAFAVRLTMMSGRTVDFPVRPASGWSGRQWCLGRHEGETVRRISVVAGARRSPEAARLLLGSLSVNMGCAAR